MLIFVSLSNNKNGPNLRTLIISSQYEEIEDSSLLDPFI
jgi:hypothetical protein